MRTSSQRLSGFFLGVVSIGITLTMLPSLARAASVTNFLNAGDTQRVTRADFVRAVVKAAGLPTPETGALPYDGVADALKPYIRAAEKKKALAVFAREGRNVKFEKQLLRGEALSIIEAILAGVPSADAKNAAKKFTDATTDADRTLAALAVERSWMKPMSETLFGFKKTLRGKEAKLLLSRAFQLSAPSEGTETLSTPVIRIKLLGTTNNESAPKSDLLQSVWNALRRNYLYRDKLTVDKAGDKAIEGLVNSLGDPYTVYLPKTKNEDFKLQMKGEVEGIGATVEMTGGVLTIVSPLRSSPAEKAGLLPKDQILSVDGQSLNGLTLDEAVRHVRGPRGSSAVLKIRRSGSEFDVTVTREKVMIPEVEVVEDRNVTIVKLLQFWDTTDTKFRTMMAEVQGRNPRGIILDLRNNPGGLLHAAGTVMSSFLPKSSPYISIMEIDQTRSETTEEDQVVKDSIPMIVLVNKGSASASEIVAGALQDAGRAKLVGETTYGKGTVQQVTQFPDGSSLKYTIAEWRTPSGRKIDKVGVTPDFVVTNVGGPAGKDLQMEKAMELLR